MVGEAATEVRRGGQGIGRPRHDDHRARHFVRAQVPAAEATALPVVYARRCGVLRRISACVFVSARHPRPPVSRCGRTRRSPAACSPARRVSPAHAPGSRVARPRGAGDLINGSSPEPGVMQPAGSTRRSARSLSPLSRLSAAILGMHNLSPATRTILLQLSPASLSRLETELERHDSRRTGIVELERFHRALTLARIPCTEAATGIERRLACYTACDAARECALCVRVFLLMAF